MKFLKIENNCGLYSIDGATWRPIDKINRDDLFKLLNLAIDCDFEMDDYDQEKLANPAHQIIYNNIYQKFNELLKNKTHFKDESESLYKAAIEKYSTN